MRVHNRARGWALQALYAWEVRGAAPHMPIPVLHDLYENLRVSPTNQLYAEVLVRLVAENLARIDRLIEDNLENWRLSRLSLIDRNLLRLGCAELLYVDDVPTRYTVREMVRLAEKYGTPESPRFVNGVLDAIARRAVPRKVVPARD